MTRGAPAHRLVLNRSDPGWTARARLPAVRATGRVSSPDATREQLEELCQYVEDTYPVRDSLACAVPVSTTLETF